MIGPFSYIEIVGAFLTTILVIAALARSTPETRNANAIFVASTGTLLTLLISLRFVLLPIVNDDLRLKQLSEQNENARKVLQILSQVPSRMNHPLMTYIFRLRMTTLDEYYENATHGRVVIDQSELPSFLLKLIRSAKSSILASSYAQPASWWDLPWGKEYEKENEAAVKRGVSVTRTFLFANASELAAIRPLLIKESEAGIHVKYIYVSDLHADLVNGLVCLDDSISGELHMTPQKGVKEAEFYTDSDNVDLIRSKIQEIQDKALPL